MPDESRASTDASGTADPPSTTEVSLGPTARSAPRASEADSGNIEATSPNIVGSGPNQKGATSASASGSESGTSLPPHGWNLAKAKDAASILQSIALTAAVVIGGIWTRGVFAVTHQKEVAEVQLVKLQVEAREALKKGQPIINLTSAVTARLVGGNFLQVDVVLTNTGTAWTDVDLTLVDLYLTKIDDVLPTGDHVWRDPSRRLKFQSVYPSPVNRQSMVAFGGPSRIMLQPNMPVTLSAAQTVNEGGYYQISFGISADPQPLVDESDDSRTRISRAAGGQYVSRTDATAFVFVP
jgi:hypothetical protein